MPTDDLLSQPENANTRLRTPDIEQPRIDNRPLVTIDDMRTYWNAASSRQSVSAASLPFIEIGPFAFETSSNDGGIQSRPAGTGARIIRPPDRWSSEQPEFAFSGLNHLPLLNPQGAAARALEAQAIAEPSAQEPAEQQRQRNNQQAETQARTLLRGLSQAFNTGEMQATLTTLNRLVDNAGCNQFARIYLRAIGLMNDNFQINQQALSALRNSLERGEQPGFTRRLDDQGAIVGYTRRLADSTGNQVEYDFNARGELVRYKDQTGEWSRSTDNPLRWRNTQTNQERSARIDVLPDGTRVETDRTQPASPETFIRFNGGEREARMIMQGGALRVLDSLGRIRETVGQKGHRMRYGYGSIYRNGQIQNQLNEVYYGNNPVPFTTSTGFLWRQDGDPPHERREHLTLHSDGTLTELNIEARQGAGGATEYMPIETTQRLNGRPVERQERADLLAAARAIAHLLDASGETVSGRAAGLNRLLADRPASEVQIIAELYQRMHPEHLQQRIQDVFRGFMGAEASIRGHHPNRLLDHLRRADGPNFTSVEADHAGEIYTALTEMSQSIFGRSREQCERAIVLNLTMLNSEQIRTVANHYQTRYNADLFATLERSALSSGARQIIGVFRNGNDRVSDEQRAQLMLGILNGNPVTLAEFKLAAAVSTPESRQRFMEMCGGFNTMAARLAARFTGAADRLLHFGPGTRQIARGEMSDNDAVQVLARMSPDAGQALSAALHGRVSEAQVIRESTGVVWNGETTIDNVIQNIPEERRRLFVRGEYLDTQRNEATGQSDVEALAFYQDLRSAVSQAYSNPWRIAQRLDRIRVSGGGLISLLAHTATAAGPAYIDFLGSINNLTRTQWDAIVADGINPQTGQPRYLERLSNVRANLDTQQQANFDALANALTRRLQDQQSFATLPEDRLRARSTHFAQMSAADMQMLLDGRTVTSRLERQAREIQPGSPSPLARLQALSESGNTVAQHEMRALDFFRTESFQAGQRGGSVLEALRDAQRITNMETRTRAVANAIMNMTQEERRDYFNSPLRREEINAVVRSAFGVEIGPVAPGAGERGLTGGNGHAPGLLDGFNQFRRMLDLQPALPDGRFNSQSNGRQEYRVSMPQQAEAGYAVACQLLQQMQPILGTRVPRTGNGEQFIPESPRQNLISDLNLLSYRQPTPFDVVRTIEQRLAADPFLRISLRPGMVRDERLIGQFQDATRRAFRATGQNTNFHYDNYILPLLEGRSLTVEQLRTLHTRSSEGFNSFTRHITGMNTQALAEIARDQAQRDFLLRQYSPEQQTVLRNILDRATVLAGPELRARREQFLNQSRAEDKPAFERILQEGGPRSQQDLTALMGLSATARQTLAGLLTDMNQNAVRPADRLRLYVLNAGMTTNDVISLLAAMPLPHRADTFRDYAARYGNDLQTDLYRRAEPAERPNIERLCRQTPVSAGHIASRAITDSTTSTSAFDAVMRRLHQGGAISALEQAYMDLHRAVAEHNRHSNNRAAEPPADVINRLDAYIRTCQAELRNNREQLANHIYHAMLLVASTAAAPFSGGASLTPLLVAAAAGAASKLTIHALVEGGDFDSTLHNICHTIASGAADGFFSLSRTEHLHVLAGHGRTAAQRAVTDLVSGLSAGEARAIQPYMQQLEGRMSNLVAQKISNRAAGITEQEVRALVEGTLPGNLQGISSQSIGSIARRLTSNLERELASPTLGRQLLRSLSDFAEAAAIGAAQGTANGAINLLQPNTSPYDILNSAAANVQFMLIMHSLGRAAGEFGQRMGLQPGTARLLTEEVRNAQPGRPWSDAARRAWNILHQSGVMALSEQFNRILSGQIPDPAQALENALWVALGASTQRLPNASPGRPGQDQVSQRIRRLVDSASAHLQNNTSLHDRFLVDIACNTDRSTAADLAARCTALELLAVQPPTDGSLLNRLAVLNNGSQDPVIAALAGIIQVGDPAARAARLQEIANTQQNFDLHSTCRRIMVELAPGLENANVRDRLLVDIACSNARHNSSDSLSARSAATMLALRPPTDAPLLNQLAALSNSSQDPVIAALAGTVSIRGLEARAARLREIAGSSQDSDVQSICRHVAGRLSGLGPSGELLPGQLRPEFPRLRDNIDRLRQQYVATSEPGARQAAERALHRELMNLARQYCTSMGLLEQLTPAAVAQLLQQHDNQAQGLEQEGYVVRPNTNAAGSFDVFRPLLQANQLRLFLTPSNGQSDIVQGYMQEGNIHLNAASDMAQTLLHELNHLNRQVRRTLYHDWNQQLYTDRAIESATAGIGAGGMRTDSCDPTSNPSGVDSQLVPRVNIADAGARNLLRDLATQFIKDHANSSDMSAVNIEGWLQARRFSPAQQAALNTLNRELTGQQRTLAQELAGEARSFQYVIADGILDALTRARLPHIDRYIRRQVESLHNQGATADNPGLRHITQGLFQDALGSHSESRTVDYLLSRDERRAYIAEQSRALRDLLANIIPPGQVRTNNDALAQFLNNHPRWGAEVRQRIQDIRYERAAIALTDAIENMQRIPEGDPRRAQARQEAVRAADTFLRMTPSNLPEGRQLIAHLRGLGILPERLPGHLARLNERVSEALPHNSGGASGSAARRRIGDEAGDRPRKTNRPHPPISADSISRLRTRAPRLEKLTLVKLMPIVPVTLSQYKTERSQRRALTIFCNWQGLRTISLSPGRLSTE